MQTVKTTVGYRYDEAGYLISDAIVQENQARPGHWMMPDRVTLEKPDESKLKTHFVRFVDSQWTYEAIPTSAAWFIGKQISHKSQTLHDRTLRALLQKLVKEDSEHYRIIRGTPEEGLYWSVEAIPEKTVDEVRAAKLSELDSAFMSWYEDKATVTTSLGFVADSDARAMMDVNGLVTTLEAQPAETRASVAFMDANNEAHLLTLDQLKTVQVEIIQNGQSAYQQKWTMRYAIESAQTKEELDAIEIKFTAEDFSA